MADERMSGRLTPEQTLRLHSAMQARVAELGMRPRHLYPVSKSTYYSMGSGALALNLSTLPNIDTAMWWESGSALDYALDRGPIRPKPRPTPLQWMIFDIRSREKLSFEDVAGLAGSDDKGPLLTSSNVHRLEREATKRRPGDRTIRGLAKAFGVTEKAISDTLAQAAIGEQQTDDAYLERELRRILAKVDLLDEQGRADWIATADLLADALLRALRQVQPEPPKPHLDQTLHELGDIDPDEFDEAFRRLDDAESSSSNSPDRDDHTKSD